MPIQKKLLAILDCSSSHWVIFYSTASSTVS